MRAASRPACLAELHQRTASTSVRSATRRGEGSERARTQRKAMGRRKASTGLIPKRRARVPAFSKRKESLKRKASELSTLCAVDVALVVAAAEGDGAAAADVWESRDGVLDRYRALGPEVRARHTHRAYLEAELGKEEAKLARVRQGGPGGLDRWDKALDGVTTAEEAQRLLDDIDAAIRAADDRRRALGMPVDGEDGGAGVVLEGIVPLNFDAGVDDGYLLHAPADTNAQAMPMWGNNAGFQFQPLCRAANMQPGGSYGFQQCNCGNGAGMDGYHLQMAPDMYGASSSNNNGRLATDMYGASSSSSNNAMQHGYGFQGARASYFVPPSGYQMQQVLGRDAAQPNLTMWSTDEPRHAMVPVDYPSAESGLNYMGATEAYGAEGSGGMAFTMGASSNFINAPPAALSLAMGNSGGGGGNFIDPLPPAASSHTMSGAAGTGDNFTNPTPAQPLAMSYGGDLTLENAGRYATQWQPAQQPQSTGSGQQPSMEQLCYLSDLEDTQLNLWGN